MTGKEAGGGAEGLKPSVVSSFLLKAGLPLLQDESWPQGAGGTEETLRGTAIVAHFDPFSQAAERNMATVTPGSDSADFN
eukprot:337814-Rhodomonas_salina.1